MALDAFSKPGSAVNKKYVDSLNRFWKMAGSPDILNYPQKYAAVDNDHKEYEILNQVAEAMLAISRVTTGQLPNRISKTSFVKVPLFCIFPCPVDFVASLYRHPTFFILILLLYKANSQPWLTSTFT
jgi:hypothetical protein